MLTCTRTRLPVEMAMSVQALVYCTICVTGILHNYFAFQFSKQYLLCLAALRNFALKKNMCIVTCICSRVGKNSDLEWLD